ncbi:MAG: redox-sensing transcriptional repressor Rex [Armatimonadota bacterium]|nr:redox-sensing transcriptional repressor Rex [bacterium]
MTPEKNKIGSLPAVRRLPTYLHLLRSFSESGREMVSSTHIAEKLKIEPIQVRKDLAITGIEGKPKVGYYIPALIDAIETFLGWNNTTDAFLVGVGNLGSALLGYEGFRKHGLKIVAAFDADDSRVGQVIGDVEVLPIHKLSDLAMRMHVPMGVIAVPAESAQSVADAMVLGGIQAIWNFAPRSLDVPDGVVVQNEDLASGLAVLSVKLARTREIRETAGTMLPAGNGG